MGLQELHGNMITNTLSREVDVINFNNHEILGPWSQWHEILLVVLKMNLNVKDNDKCIIAFRFTAFYADTGTMVPISAASCNCVGGHITSTYTDNRKMAWCVFWNPKLLVTTENVKIDTSAISSETSPAAQLGPWSQLNTVFFGQIYQRLVGIIFCTFFSWDHGPIKIPIQSESSIQEELISRVLWQKRLCLNQPDSTDVFQWFCGMQKKMMKQWVAVDCDCEFHKYGMKRIQWDHGPGNTLYAHNRMFEKIEDKKIAC